MGESLEGVIVRITYQSDDTGYLVATVDTSHQGVVTIVGTSATLHVGDTVMLKGNWTTHATYGRQFKFDSVQICMPTQPKGIIRYLASGLIKGVGPKYAELIVNFFGKDTLDIIDRYPERLRQVPGLGKKRLEAIIESWKQEKEQRQSMVFCYELGMGTKLALRVIQTYQSNTIAVIRENPYQLIQDIWGIGFVLADKMALTLGLLVDSPQRVSAALSHVLLVSNQHGHVCLPVDTLIQNTMALLTISEDIILKTYQMMIDHDELIEAVHGGISMVWSKKLKDAEEGILRHFQRLSGESRVCDANLFDWVEHELGMTYARQQKRAIQLALDHKVLLITGGPGTGKSTIVRAIATAFKHQDQRIKLAAPTGRAAKRLQIVSGYEASTIHSLLTPNFRTMQFEYHAGNPLELDLLIVDEASMIDTMLMFELLDALPNHAHVILVGDANQLPSIGPGRVFLDLLETEVLPSVRLTEIYRQAADSQIVKAAHMILNGQIPPLKTQKDSDFFFLERHSPQDIQETILDLFLNRLPKSYGWKVTDIQILCPQHRGDLGTLYFNHEIQQLLSTDQTAKLGPFYLADKVMQLRNQHQKGVYNGDIGTVSEIHEDELLVEFEEDQFAYQRSDLEELSLAYAVSVHKFQGSEYPAIIMPIHRSHSRMLFKNLIYTAMTRAKSLLILVGDPKIFEQGIQNRGAERRFTGLSKL